MSKVAIIAKITTKPGQGATAVTRLTELFGPVGDEPGTEVYSLHTEAANPDVIWFYELYVDNDAMVAHGGSEALAAAFKDLRDVTAAKPEITVLTPVKSKGLSF